jgi:hypothetical protein
MQSNHPQGHDFAMNYIQVTDQQEIQAAFVELSARLRNGSRPYRRTIGFHGGSFSRTVHWHADHGIWATADSRTNKHRFWIAFGTKNPVEYSYREPPDLDWG